MILSPAIVRERDVRDGPSGCEVKVEVGGEVDKIDEF